MSQAKVDRYKEEKRNRAKIMAREKREKLLLKIGGTVVAAAIVFWAGFSVYDSAVNKPVDTQTAVTEDFTIDTAALDDYISGLSVN